MAFSSSVVGKMPLGDKQLVYGTYTSNGGSTGGDVSTQLSVVDGAWLQPNKNAVIATQSTVDATFPRYNNPLSTVSVKIVTSADEVGYWYAFGKP